MSLSGLRFHDLRHDAITELAESQASDSTIMSIAGQVSPKMLAHYSHIRIEAKRKALDALVELERKASHDTSRDTNYGNFSAKSPQVFDKFGGDDETRTRDLCRDSLGINVLSATYILAGAAKSLKGTVGTVRCG